MKAGFIQMGRIGDMILITPLFAEFKKLFPDSEVHVFAGPSNSSILVNNPNIHKVYTIEKSPTGIFKTISKLLFTKFDYWIDPKDHFSKESRLIAQVVNAKIKIGFNKEGLKQVFDIGIKPGEEFVHHSLIALNSLESFSFKLPQIPIKPQLFVSEESESYVGSFLSEVGGNFVVLNISGSMEHKMWDIQNWVEFLKNVEINLPVVLCFAPSEKHTADKLIDQCPELLMFNSRNINDIVSLVSRCNYLISPDTAIVHIAAAFNCPVFALYSGLDTFYKKFHPLSDIQISVRADKGDHGIKSISTNKALIEFHNFKKLISD